MSTAKTTLQTSKIFRLVNNAYQSGYTTVSAQGGARSGKTYNILIWILSYTLQHPNTKVTVARATLPALKKTVLEDFKAILISLNIYNERSLNKTELTYQLPNGSHFEFISTDSEQKLRGGKRDILFCNEANELSYIAWQQLKMRTTKFAIIDYNPSFGTEHWIHTEVNSDSRTQFFKTTYRDNPFLEATIIEEIESLKTKNPSLWKVYGEGETAKIEGLIFDEYKVVDAIPSYVKKRWYGIDYGYTNDPTAIVLVALHNDELYIHEIAYLTHLLTSEIIATLKEAQATYGRYKIISESAEPRIIDEVAKAGLLIYPVRKYAGSINAGILKMQEYQLNITKDSTNVKKELNSYTWLKDKDGVTTNTPIDCYNHAIDATRYVVLSEILGANGKPVNIRGIARRIGRL